MEPIVTTGRLLVGTLFLVAAVSKLRRMHEFAGAVEAYQLIPRRLIGPVAKTVPVSEFLIGCAMVADVQTHVAATAATLMLLIFAAAMTINLRRGRRIDCGCLGKAEDAKITWPLVLRNVALAFMGGAIAVWSTTNVADSAVDFETTTTSAFAAALVILSYICLTQVVRTWRASTPFKEAM